MNLRAKIAARTEHLLRRLPRDADLGSPSPSEPTTPARLDPLAGQALTIPCWCCSERLAGCARADCPKVWRLKDCPALASEGKAGRQ